MAAGTCKLIRPRVMGSSSAVELSRLVDRAGTPFSVRISTRRSRSHGGGVTATTCREEAPSCIYVGPIETASKETLEALYRQARDAYHRGKPLIVDDMFDRVELKLRWYGSKSVVKYPRCSLRRQSTYADAEEDLSQVFALASIWTLIFGFGSLACVLPAIYSFNLAFGDAFELGFAHDSQLYSMLSLTKVNGVLFMLLGSAIGYPVASAAVRVLLRLWINDLVGLKGACPNCGEEVFAFVRSDQSNSSAHRADCHVCECTLEFRTKVEKSISRLGRKWVYGRIYLVSHGGRNQLRK